MSQTVEAIYEGGVFRPLTPVDLPEQTRVTIPLSEPVPEEEADDDEERLSRGVMNVKLSGREIARVAVDLRNIPRGVPRANFSWTPPPERDDEDA